MENQETVITPRQMVIMALTSSIPLSEEEALALLDTYEDAIYGEIGAETGMW